MKSKSKKSAGKANDGNVTVDLGEKHHQKIERMIESKLATAGMAGARPGLNLPSRFGGNPRVSGRPGMFGGGYKPWYSRFGKPWMGQDAASITAFTVPGAPGRRINIIPIDIQTVKTADVLTGGAMGLLGNRAIVRLLPKIWPAAGTNAILNEGVAFGASLLPLLFKRNAMTVGVALPGAVYFFGTLVDMLYNAVGMPAKPANMSGAQASADPNQGARQRLAAIQQRINTPQASQQRSLPRVMAVAQ
jgi:hypothetical protein